MIAAGILAGFLAVVTVLHLVRLWRKPRAEDHVSAKWLDEHIRDRRTD